MFDFFPPDETSNSLDENLLEAMAKHETQDDKIFQKFKERISLEPEQVLKSHFP